MIDRTKGVLAMAAASTIWGLSPLYYKLIAEVPPLEVLSHRTLWSLLFFALVLALQGRLAEVPKLLRGYQLLVVGFAAVMISANWFMFILAVQTGHAVQASLGYYIFPLFAVVTGFLVFGERLSLAQGIAVGLAALAVVVLTLGLGVAPWLSLMLAATFAIYGLIKKRIDAGPVVSVAAEVLLLSPFALVWLAVVHSGMVVEIAGRSGGWFGRDWQISLLLAFSGVLTGGPLVLFSYASRRISMASLGLTQYLNPTLQFLCATLVFKEPFTHWHLVAFGLIWTALAIYSIEALRQDRAARRALANVGTSGTVVM